MRSEQVHNRTLYVVIGLMFCTVLYAAFWLKRPGNVPAGETPSVELLPESRVSVRVQGDHKSRLHFQIRSNRYFRVLVQGPPTELSLSLYGPDRRAYRSTGCIGGVIRISEIANTGGEYHLELSSCDPQSDDEYYVTLAPVRTVVDADRLRVVAERTSEDADRLTLAKPSQRSAALLKYEGALEIWRTVGDRVEELRTLRNAATLYRDSGRSVKALEYFSRALELTGAEPSDIDRAGILRGIASVHLRNGDVAQALEYSSQALNVSRSNVDRNGEAEGLLVVGDVYYWIGDYGKAADADNQAYTIWETLRHRRGQARSLLELAAIDSDRNNFKQAFDHALRAQSLFGALNDYIGRAKSSALLGHILSSTGRKQEALDLLEQARPILIDSGDLTSEAALANAFARVYADLGDYDSALPFSKLALERYATLGNRVTESHTLWAMGYYYFRAGDLNNARLHLERALKGFHTLSNRRSEAYCWRDLGVVYQALHKREMARDTLNRSLEMSRAVIDRRLEASVLVALGRLTEASGDNKAALQLYRDSLRLHRATEDRLGEITALYHLASCLRRMGEFEQSKANSEAAVEIIERLRTSLVSSGLRTFYFASARQAFDVYIDSLMRGQGGTGPDMVKAFELSERARARTLLESISETRLSISEGVDRDLVEHEAMLRAAIEAKSEQHTELLSVDPGSKELANLNDELGRLNAQYDELHGQLLIRNPRYATLVQPKPLKLQEVQQQVVGDDSLLLEYALGEKNSYLWAITREGFASYVLPRRSEIEKKVRRVRDLLTARLSSPGETNYLSRVRTAEAQYPQAAAELSQILLGPVADKLATRRLVIVAEGALQYLPFGALPTPQSARTLSFTPLVFEHEVVNLPSASTLAVIRREDPGRGKPDRTVAVFADPVFQAQDPRVSTSSAPAEPKSAGTTQPAAGVAGLSQTFRGNPVLGIGIKLPRLPFTRLEADTILEMVPPDRRLAALGFNATKAVAMNPELKRYRIVHFATHTILNDDYPDLSSLVLSLVDESGSPQNGWLWLRDMYNLHLSAELIVLSACDTALGKEVKGEGLMSMVRGFMYSGTPRVLASLWKVDDEATAELMKEFYTQVLQRGLTPAAALRQAQIVQMQKKSRQAPYYWAGFQLQGEWK